MNMTTSMLCLILAALASPLPARELPRVTPARAGLSESTLAGVSRFMERQVADGKIAGDIVMISRHGRIGFFHTYGAMDREAGKPMKPATLFRLYSMTKPITVAAALTLYDAGGAASTHCWASRTDQLIVVTLEQICLFNGTPNSASSKSSTTPRGNETGRALRQP